MNITPINRVANWLFLEMCHAAVIGCKADEYYFADGLNFLVELIYLEDKNDISDSKN